MHYFLSHRSTKAKKESFGWQYRKRYGHLEEMEEVGFTKSLMDQERKDDVLKPLVDGRYLYFIKPAVSLSPIGAVYSFPC